MMYVIYVHISYEGTLIAMTKHTLPLQLSFASTFRQDSAKLVKKNQLVEFL